MMLVAMGNIVVVITITTRLMIMATRMMLVVVMTMTVVETMIVVAMRMWSKLWEVLGILRYLMKGQLMRSQLVLIRPGVLSNGKWSCPSLLLRAHLLHRHHLQFVPHFQFTPHNRFIPHQ